MFSSDVDPFEKNGEIVLLLVFMGKLSFVFRTQYRSLSRVEIRPATTEEGKTLGRNVSRR